MGLDLILTIVSIILGGGSLVFLFSNLLLLGLIFFIFFAIVEYFRIIKSSGTALS